MINRIANTIAKHNEISKVFQETTKRKSINFSELEESMK